MAKMCLKTLIVGPRKWIVGGVTAQCAQGPGLCTLHCQKSKWYVGSRWSEDRKVSQYINKLNNSADMEFSLSVFIMGDVTSVGYGDLRFYCPSPFGHTSKLRNLNLFFGGI